MQGIYIAAMRGRDPLCPTDRSHPLAGKAVQRLEINGGGHCNALTSVGKDNLVFIDYE